MDKFLILKSFLKMISKGKFFTKISSWLLRLLALIVFLSLFYFSYKIWTIYSDARLTSSGMFCYRLIGQIIIAAFLYSILNILLVRASDINAIPISTDYTVIPIIVVLIKTFGEVFAVTFALICFVDGLSIVFGMPLISTGIGIRIPFSIYPANYYESGLILSGLITVVSSLIVGFMILSLFYFVAEQMGVFVDIARNTKKSN